MKKKKHILDRYSRTADGRIIIEVNIEKVEYLYDNFDKTSPYLKKELEQGVVEYITESVHEIGREDFVISFQLASMPDDALAERVTTSIDNYFFYLKELKLRELGRMVRTSLILLIIGVAILALSAWVNLSVIGEKTVIKTIFAEGLTVAAWVSLWESLATFLINWTPHRRQIKTYERIAAAKILFHNGIDNK